MLDAFQKQELKKLKKKISKVKDIPEELKANEEFMLEAIRISAVAMYYAAPELRIKRSFVEAAIEVNCWAYLYTRNQWKDDERLTQRAVRKRPIFLFSASERLKADENFKINALKINSWYPWIKLNKVIKNNFFEGVSDIFAIMYGNYGLLDKMDGQEFDPNCLKYGVVDLTLIPQLSSFLINFGKPAKACDSNPFRYALDTEKLKELTTLRNISAVIGFGLQFLRLGMAVAATVMVLPLVALVHVLKFPYLYYHQRSLLKLEGVIYNANTNNPISQRATLAEFIATTNSSLNDLCAYKSSSITSYSSKNTGVESYGSARSYSPHLFFKPSNSKGSTQIRAKNIATALEINERYDLTDSRTLAIGRSFY